MPIDTRLSDPAPSANAIGRIPSTVERTRHQYWSESGSCGTNNRIVNAQSLRFPLIGKLDNKGCRSSLPAQ
jgi:hypothetical protein